MDTSIARLPRVLTDLSFGIRYTSPHNCVLHGEAMCWSLSSVGILLAFICTQAHGFTAFMPRLTHRAGQMIRKGCCQTNRECQALSRPLPQQLSRTSQTMSSGRQADARLVEVQREILETGLSDTGKIGQYAVMLRYTIIISCHRRPILSCL